MAARKYWSLLLILFFAQIALTQCRAVGQPTGPESMRKLSFLAGAWSCQFNDSKLVQEITYSFSPDGLWMTELSHDQGRDTNWETQMWGYDVRTEKLVAYQFYGDTVSTKSVEGWVN